MVLTISKRHAEIFGPVHVQTDKANQFVNVWDIKEYSRINPSEEQVKKMSFWQVHEFAISAVDIVPYPRKGASESAALGSFKSLFDYVVVREKT